jgi:ATP-dependent DNA helicase DinG
MPSTLDFLSDPSLGLVREVRQSQLQMAGDVETVIREGGVFFVEGPVGVGKSLAYLVPALLAEGKRIVIATAKKQLQDQIQSKDLPAIANVLGEDLAALLVDEEGTQQLMATVVKGKANYACRLLSEKQHVDVTYNDFLRRSQFGDRAEYPGAPPVWWNNATAEDCIGRGCKHASTCGYMRLKGNVTQSKIVVVNHHMLGSDMYFGHGKMMGGPFHVLIIDEAHKLAEGIRAAFTVKVSENAIADMDEALKKTPFGFHAPARVRDVWAAMFDALPNRNWRDVHAREIPVFPHHAEDSINGLEEIDNELATMLGHYGVKGTPADLGFWETLAALNVPDDVKGSLAMVAQGRRKMTDLIRGVRTLQGYVKPNEEEGPEEYEQRKGRILENTVASGNADHRGRFHVNCAPINVGGIVKNYFSAIHATVLTSATLAVGDNFDHLADVVGVEPTKTAVLPPAFDYSKQGFLYVPKDIPFRNRSAPDYIENTRMRIDRCVQLVTWSNGGAFVLTTANDDLDEFAEVLKRKFPGRVFAQGHSRNAWDGDPPSILERFKQAPNNILVGSKSFWEGVDVVGEHLRLVVITKLPFPNFKDPIVKARERLAGESAFKRVQMVDMLTDLRQGAGRLIRSKSDRGVVAILDSRVWDKGYGRQVRAILRFPVTEHLKECEDYLPKLEPYFRRLAQRATNG